MKNIEQLLERPFWFSGELTCLILYIRIFFPLSLSLFYRKKKNFGDHSLQGKKRLLLNYFQQLKKKNEEARTHQVSKSPNSKFHKLKGECRFEH